jgi:hypothetical protein
VITAVPSSNLGFCVDDVGPSSLIVVNPRQRRKCHAQSNMATAKGVPRRVGSAGYGLGSLPARAPAVVREEILQRVRRRHASDPAPRPRPFASGRTRVACSDLKICGVEPKLRGRRYSDVLTCDRAKRFFERLAWRLDPTSPVLRSPEWCRGSRAEFPG